MPGFPATLLWNVFCEGGAVGGGTSNGTSTAARAALLLVLLLYVPFAYTTLKSRNAYSDAKSLRRRFVMREKRVPFKKYDSVFIGCALVVVVALLLVHAAFRAYHNVSHTTERVAAHARRFLDELFSIIQPESSYFRADNDRAPNATASTADGGIEFREVYTPDSAEDDADGENVDVHIDVHDGFNRCRRAYENGSDSSGEDRGGIAALFSHPLVKECIDAFRDVYEEVSGVLLSGAFLNEHDTQRNAFCSRGNMNMVGPDDGLDNTAAGYLLSSFLRPAGLASSMSIPPLEALTFVSR